MRTKSSLGYIKDIIYANNGYSKYARANKGAKNKTSKPSEVSLLKHFILTLASLIVLILVLWILCIFNIFCIKDVLTGLYSSQPQTLKLSGEQLTISHGNSVDLSAFLYTAGEGLTLQDNEFKLNPVNNNPGTYGDSVSIPIITVDKYGRVTEVTTQTVYIPTPPTYPTPPICDATHKLIFDGTDYRCVKDLDTLPDLICADGEYLTYDSTTSTWQCHNLDMHQIYDADRDTFVTTENTPDEDVVRMAAAGTQYLGLYSTGHLIVSPQVQNITNPNLTTGFFSGMYFDPNRNALLIGSYRFGVDARNIGNNSLIFGFSNSSASDYTFTFGENNSSKSNYTFLFGSGNYAENYASVAIGLNSSSYGVSSTAIGEGLIARARNSFVIGRYNVGNGSAEAWRDTDPIFEIGNGANSRVRNNAFTVLKNGFVGIGTYAPRYPLEVAHEKFPWVVSINLSDGTFAAYTAFQRGGTIHPRAMFSIGNRFLGNRIYTAGLWITPQVDRGYHKDVFFEVMTNDNVYDTNTKRLLVMQRTSYAEIRARSGRGNGPGTDLVIWTQPNRNQLFLYQAKGFVGINTNRPTETFQVGNPGDGTSAVANAWNIFSDIRFKTSIQTITDALNIIDRIKGVYFKWITNNKPSIGFIAQELQNIVPEVVNQNSSGYLSVDYARLTPILVEAIKEMHTQLDNINTQLANLINKFNALSAKLKTQTLEAVNAIVNNLTARQITTQTIIVNNPNLSGIVTIPAGQTQVQIRFTNAAAVPITPIVVASPNKPVVYSVHSVTKDGFTISLKTTQTQDITFNWIAIYNPSVNTGPIVSTTPIAPSPTPSATPSPSPITTPTVSPTPTGTPSPTLTTTPTPTPTLSTSPQPTTP